MTDAEIAALSDDDLVQFARDAAGHPLGERADAELAFRGRINRTNRYCEIVAWARARYSDEAGRWITVVGNGIAGRPGPTHMVPTRYTLIEELAAQRYLGIARRYPHETLATAHHPH